MQSVLEEQLKSQEHLSVGWPWRIFVLMLIIFSFLIFIYLGMVFGLKPYSNSQIADLNRQILNLNQSIDESQQKQLISVYSQFINLKNLLDSRKTVSQFFNFLEENTYSTVNYKSLTMDIADRTAKLAGITPDYETLTKELSLFQKSPMIEKVILENSNLNESVLVAKGPLVKEVKFEIKLILSPQFFKL